MKQPIELPVRELSYLGKVHLDLELNGEHFSQLALYNNKKPEQLALSIIQDLIDEDADNLTISELTYLMHLVKVHSLQEEIYAYSVCPHCGKEIKYHIDFAKGTLNQPVSGYKAPEISWNFPWVDKPLTCKVLPVTVARNLAIQNWFEEVLDVDILSKDATKEQDYQYTMMIALSTLVDKDNKPYFTRDYYNDVDKILKLNKFSSVTQLIKHVKDVNSYGPSLSKVTCTCGGCNKDATFRASILIGLTT